MTNRKRVNIKAILTDPVLREELVEGATDFICKVENIRRDPLSSAAQAVAWAYDNTPEKDTGNHRYHWLAAALRAAAGQVVPDKPAPDVASLKEFERWDAKRFVRLQFLAIAAELEGAQ